MKLEGLRIGKIWRSGEIFVFEVTGGFLIVRPGGFYFSRYAPRGEPDGFSMYLRKHVSGRIIKGVKQHNLDRVVFLDLGDHALVFELFGKGNIVLLENGKVVAFLRKSDRIVRGEAYTPPESVNYLDWNEFKKAIEGRDKREVARALGIGKLVEEVWGEPKEMWEKLTALASEPIDPKEIESKFKQGDLNLLSSARDKRVNAARKKLEKTIKETEQLVLSYKEKAHLLREAATRIMSNLYEYDQKLEEARKQRKRVIKL